MSKIQAKVKKGGQCIRGYVKPDRTQTCMCIDPMMLQESLRDNVRLVLTDSKGNAWMDVYNYVTSSGVLKPVARCLKHFVENCHKDQPEITYKGKRVTRDEVAKMNEAYHREVANRRKAIPVRMVKVPCKKCGYVNEVEIGGFSN